MRGSFPGHARWLLAIFALVVLGGTSIYRDAEPGRVTRPGFTLFSVDQIGAQTPLALFDGLAWRSPCEASEGVSAGAVPRGAPAPSSDPDPTSSSPIAGLAGSRDAPLLRVRELTADSAGWEPTADAVETRAVAETGFAGPRRTNPSVYSADSAGTGVAYVEVVVQEPEPAFRGFMAAAWVFANEPSAPSLVEFRVRPFSSYADYLAIERWVPLGLAGEGDEQVWVMKHSSVPGRDIRLVGVAPRGAIERLRVVSGGC